MAMGTSVLRGEMRRHMGMNVLLVAGSIVGATVVTNERGLFVPINFRMSESARAFSALFTQSSLAPEMTEVRMISPLDPFEVTADSRDLRRRLMDSLSWLPEEASEYNKELAQMSDQVLSPTEVASLTPGEAAAAGVGDAAPAGGEQSASTSTSTSTPAAETSSTPSSTSNSEVLPSTNSPAATPEMSPTQMAQMPAGGDPVTVPTDPTAAVPEPSVWAMMIAGFGAIGFALRRRRRREPAAA